MVGKSRSGAKAFHVYKRSLQPIITIGKAFSIQQMVEKVEKCFREIYKFFQVQISFEMRIFALIVGCKNQQRVVKFLYFKMNLFSLCFVYSTVNMQ